MKIAAIIGATLYFIGFCLLAPWEHITDFYAWTRKRIDEFGKVPHPVRHAVWSEKVRPFLGFCFLVFGSFINLILVISKY
jgi:hypothetical protein